MSAILSHSRLILRSRCPVASLMSRARSTLPADPLPAHAPGDGSLIIAFFAIAFTFRSNVFPFSLSSCYRTEARSEYLTLCDTRRPSGPDVPLSPLKSPLIRSAYHTISLRLDGSPLLSDYGYTESDSPTSTSSSIQHFYERPAYAEYVDRNLPAQHSFQLLQNNGHPPPPSLPPLPPERRLIHLQNLYQRQTLHHHSHVHQHPPHSSSSHRQLPHQPAYHYSNPHHTVYRSLSRNRTASRSEYGDFHS